MDFAHGDKTRKLAATCPICRLMIEGSLNQDFLCELPHTMIHRGPFASRWPGAVQVSSRRHLNDPSQLKYPHFIHSQSELYAIESAVTKVTAAHHMNVVKFGNVVGHLHWHIIPRFSNETFPQKTPWELEGLAPAALFHTPPKAPADLLYEDIMEAVRANLKSAQPPYFATAFFIRPTDVSARAAFFSDDLAAQWQQIRACPDGFECFLMQRNYLDFAWDTFGGEIDAGETPQQALTREIREELGWSLDRCLEVTRQWNHGMVRGFVYLCTPDAQQLLLDTPPRTACDEVKTARWIPLQTLVRNASGEYSHRLAGRAQALVQGLPDFICE